MLPIVMARRSNKDQANEDGFEPGLIEFVEIEDGDAEEEADTRWLIQHYSELVQEYPMSWVAVHHQQVVGHGSTPNRAMMSAIKALKETGHPDPGMDDEYNPVEREGARVDKPHLYFLERSAEWIREH